MIAAPATGTGETPTPTSTDTHGGDNFKHSLDKHRGDVGAEYVGSGSGGSRDRVGTHISLPSNGGSCSVSWEGEREVEVSPTVASIRSADNNRSASLRVQQAKAMTELAGVQKAKDNDFIDRRRISKGLGSGNRGGGEHASPHGDTATAEKVGLLTETAVLTPESITPSPFFPSPTSTRLRVSSGALSATRPTGGNIWGGSVSPVEKLTQQEMGNPTLRLSVYPLEQFSDEEDGA